MCVRDLDVRTRGLGLLCSTARSAPDTGGGVALSVALLDASAGGHAGESSAYDTLLFVGVYVALYLTFTLLNHRHSGMWVYPIFDKLIEKKGPVGFWLLACPVAVAYISVGFLGQALVG